MKDDSCCFGDILDVTPQKYRKLVGLDGGKEQPATKLARRLCKCDVKTEAWCFTHQRMCRIKSADIHVAGSPCKDHSTFNSHGKKFKGPHAKLFYIWVAMRRKLREKVWVHENVASFGEAELRLRLGDLYIIIRLVTDPSKDGFAIYRRRQYCIGLLRSWLSDALPPVVSADGPTQNEEDRAVIEALNLQTTQTQLFKARCGYTWEAYFLGNDEEATKDLEWARNRPGVKRRHAKPISDEAAKYKRDSMWLGALTVAERDRLEAYKSKWPGEVGDLGQNPNKRALRSKRGKLPTLIAGMGIMFSPKHNRWYFPSELWLSMGFPVTEDDVSRTGVMCQFSRGFPSVPGRRSRASQLTQIGNAMHVESIGSVLLTVFLKLAKPLNVKKRGHSQPDSDEAVCKMKRHKSL